MRVLIETRAKSLPLSRTAPDKRIDWSDSSDRKWLMNHLHWAMMNAQCVTLTPDSNCTHLEGKSDNGNR